MALRIRTLALSSALAMGALVASAGLAEAHYRHCPRWHHPHAATYGYGDVSYGQMPAAYGYTPDYAGYGAYGYGPGYSGPVWRMGTYLEWASSASFRALKRRASAHAGAL